MTKNSERTEIEAEEASMATWDCGSPLYDSYELVSLDHLIQRHLMVIPSLARSKRLSSNYYYQYDVQDTSSLAVTRGNSSSSIMSTFSEFVGRKLSKRKDKQKRSKNVLSSLCYRFGFPKK
ncbi:hypothetical protein AB3S75_025644 [Citrus x aurantiifolia]